MSNWNRFCQHYLSLPQLEFALDISRMRFKDDFLKQMEPAMQAAFQAMDNLEAGAIANPDENRMVGHYWLRTPKLAPENSITTAICDCLEGIKKIAADVHEGKLSGAGGAFRNLLVIGIGGSALGPQFVAEALGHPQTDRLQLFFFDNTDPDGMDRVLAKLAGQLDTTLVVVISKSGGTPETRNGMLEAQCAYQASGVDFARHAIAITGADSKLDTTAKAENWLARLPMWDWVGGRTSELAAVGLLPAALQGFDIDGLLTGAAEMDAATRKPVTAQNPAALLALMWYYATNGRGDKDMVVLPYKDRLALFSKYLQQLIMESLGKATDLDGKQVNQGLAVYGNKGSTDQHAYVQQLREGVHNFFVTFIEVLQDREGASISVEPGISSGDFLEGFYLGTREALYEAGRDSLTLTIVKVDAKAIGRLIALFERAVGFYASLVNINAYHQPGVEAGKKAAAGILELQTQIVDFLKDHPNQNFNVAQLTETLQLKDRQETVFKCLMHLQQNTLAIKVNQALNPNDCVFTFVV
jgi:glucose-6-phosphate isomerase